MTITLTLATEARMARYLLQLTATYMASVDPRSRKMADVMAIVFIEQIAAQIESKAGELRAKAQREEVGEVSR